MSPNDKPADTSPRAPVPAPSQDTRLSHAPVADPVAVAEDHLAGVDMAAQRAIVRQLTK